MLGGGGSFVGCLFRLIATAVKGPKKIRKNKIDISKYLNESSNNTQIGFVRGRKIIFVGLALIVKKVNNAIQWINHYPLDSAFIGFKLAVIYPLDSDLSII